MGLREGTQKNFWNYKFDYLEAGSYCLLEQLSFCHQIIMWLLKGWNIFTHHLYRLHL
jgi:hypothetical protein